MREDTRYWNDDLVSGISAKLENESKIDIIMEENEILKEQVYTLTEQVTTVKERNNTLE